jgi:hypothetical protein
MRLFYSRRIEGYIGALLVLLLGSKLQTRAKNLLQKCVGPRVGGGIRLYCRFTLRRRRDKGLNTDFTGAYPPHVAQAVSTSHAMLRNAHEVLSNPRNFNLWLDVVIWSRNQWGH